MRKLDEILKNERIWGHEIMFPFHSAWVKLPDCGKCSVIWSDCEDGMEHVSISPRKQFRMPSWDDMCVLKDIFFENEEEAYQIHPKNSQYVNDVENCLHLWKPKGHEIDELTKLEKQSRWIPVSERMPKPEEEVLVTAVRKWKDGTRNYIVTPAIYEDGNVPENDSIWCWEDISGKWDEENDCMIIPEGWWENRQYNPDCMYNSAVDDEVVAWMPMPEPWEGE